MRWQVWVDTGGTFTDCLARDPSGAFHRAKVLSSSALRGWAAVLDGRVRFGSDLEAPADDLFRGGELRRLGEGGGLTVVGSQGDQLTVDGDPSSWGAGGVAAEIGFDEEAPILAARVVTGTAGGESLPDLDFRLATTRGTNALLERKGARVAFFVTRGFADLLVIGNQQRPDLFALDIVRPPPLYAEVCEVNERLDAAGGVLEVLDEAALATSAEAALEAGCDTAAVAFLHAYRNSGHEERAAVLLEAAGFGHVSRSSHLAPRIQIVPRAATAVVNAYLAPQINDYVDGVAGAAGAGRLRVMASSGGLRDAKSFEPRDSLLSGPAAGVVGAAASGRAAGERELIAFDMGGTSTDVSRIGEALDYTFETRVGDATIVAPALAIETVAAGGGSICHFDGHQFGVGPASAGAYPGPACYGAGGPLTLTDVNLLLGRLDAGRLPIPLDPSAAREAADELVASVTRATGQECDLLDALSGLLTIANERMAEAIRTVSLRRGHRTESHCLVAFGGAGPQHACAVAELLGIRRVLVPADGGLLSAAGLGAARLEEIVDAQVLAPWSEVEDSLARRFAELEERAVARAADGTERWQIDRRLAALRLAGQETALLVDCDSGDPVLAWSGQYEELYGYPPPALDVEVESLRLVASAVSTDGRDARREPASPAERAESSGEQRAWLGGQWETHRWYDRGQLAAGNLLSGPALLFEEHSATVVEAGWSCRADPSGALVLDREEPA